MLKKSELIPIWSNIPFLLPAIIAVNKGLWGYGLLIVIATVVSLIHHMDTKLDVKTVDQFLASSVILANLYVLYLSGWKQPNFAIALLFVALAFYFFFKAQKTNYELNHGLWHLCSVVITLMCTLAY